MPTHTEEVLRITSRQEEKKTPPHIIIKTLNIHRKTEKVY